MIPSTFLPGSVFCNSRQALYVGLGDKIGAKTTILTNSPALIADPPDGATCISLADRTTPESVLRLLSDLPDICLAAYQRIGEVSGDSLVGVIAARQIRNLYIFLYHALQLEAADLEEPRIVIQVGSPGSADGQRLNPPWPALLADNHKLLVRNVRLEELPPQELAAEKPPPILRRLLLKSAGDWEYKFWNAIWSVLPRGFSRGICVAPDNNPLLRECAAALGRHGFAITRMQPNEASEPQCYPESLKQMIASELNTDLDKILASRILPGLASPIRNHFRAMLNQALDDFVKSRNAWKALIKECPDQIRVMLVNTLVTPQHIGQYAAARDHGIPVVSFQHGHGREYMDGQEVNEIAEEHLTSDLVIAYTEEYARATRESRFCSKPAAAIGIPADYFRGRRKRQVTAPQEEIAYISTAIFGSHHLFPLGATLSDRFKVEFERTLINDVLAKLPYRCLFKPYISQLYLDDMGLQEIAARTSNVHYDTRWLNLSYILSNHRLLITSRATSTLGWCLASAKPLVFINFPNHYPLKADLRPLFEHGIFVFEYGTADFFSKLRTFLSRPLEEIEAEWRDKAVWRADLEKQVLGDRGKHAGERAAIAVENLLSQRTNQ